VDFGPGLVTPVVVAVLQLVGVHFAARGQPAARPLDALGILLLEAGPAALLLRRRFPLTVLAVAHASTLVYWLLHYPRGPVFLSSIVAFFSAVQVRGRIAWVFLPIGFVAFLWVGPALGREPAPSLIGVVSLCAWLLVLGLVAEGVRVRRERIAEQQRIDAEAARRRASEERLRIARELHDVLAHDISLINVQAGVALHLMDERPEQARTALTAIKQASKDALRELRSTLDVLRQVDEAPPRHPATGLARLDELVAGAAAAGLRVRTEVEGAARALPPEVDLAAFRIVQEGLTNATRHAGPGTTATVLVAYGAGDLTVQVEDDGRGGGTGAPGGGNGIPGMRERATALGGRLEAGPRTGGGFRVRATIPLDGQG
jgi:signal transduction histidine kinase